MVLTSDAIKKIVYVGNGTTDTYAYSWKIYEKENLEVSEKVISAGVVTILDVDVDYTVSGVGDGGGGNVVLTAGKLPSTKELIVRMNISKKQLTDYIENDEFPAALHEDGLDKLTYMCLQLQEELDRCIKGDVSQTSAYTLPAPVAGKVIGWNDAANNFENYDNSAAASIAAEAAKVAAQAAQTGAETAESNAETAEAGAVAAKIAAQAAQAAIEALNVLSNVKVGSFTRTLSTASGTQAVTGVGFQPRLIVVFSLKAGSSDLERSWGMSDGTSQFAVWWDDNSGTFSTSGSFLIYLRDTAGTVDGALSSLDADGFTINFTKTSSPTGTGTFGYIAIG